MVRLNDYYEIELIINRADGENDSKYIYINIFKDN